MATDSVRGLISYYTQLPHIKYISFTHTKLYILTVPMKTDVGTTYDVDV